MKLLNILFLCLCLPIFGFTIADRVDNRNFALDTYYPTPNEMRLGEQRGQRYWQNNSLSAYLQADHWLAGTVTWQGISDGETKLK